MGLTDVDSMRRAREEKRKIRAEQAKLVLTFSSLLSNSNSTHFFFLPLSQITVEIEKLQGENEQFAQTKADECQAKAGEVIEERRRTQLESAQFIPPPSPAVSYETLYFHGNSSNTSLSDFYLSPNSSTLNLHSRVSFSCPTFFFRPPILTPSFLLLFFCRPTAVVMVAAVRQRRMSRPGRWKRRL